MADLHTGDIGTDLVLAIVDEDGDVVDVSGATTKTIYIRKPGGTVLTKAASFDDDGTDGLVKWTTVAGDLDTAGAYQIQAKVVLADGDTFGTLVTPFRVAENLY